ncbi:ultraviolet-b receptor uvr8 [Quercus suber]|uniref:Ultraviolet-b receptor uvr8 n=1 Tax=Quercus suber TaxID=58331 RepID=A0AAW0KQD2_QUESU
MYFLGEEVPMDSLGMGNLLTGKAWVSPSERYAVVPDETVQGQASVSVSGNGNDASVPENEVKRILYARR